MDNSIDNNINVPTQLNIIFKLISRIKSEAIDFCPEHEKEEEEVQEAQSPTAPLMSLDNLLRPTTTNPGATFDEKVPEIDEKRYVVKAVPKDIEKDVKKLEETLPEEHPKVVEVEHSVEFNQSANTVSNINIT